MKKYNSITKESLLKANKFIYGGKKEQKMPIFYRDSLQIKKFKEIIQFDKDNSFSHCKYIANSYPHDIRKKNFIQAFKLFLYIL